MAYHYLTGSICETKKRLLAMDPFGLVFVGRINGEKVVIKKLLGEHEQEK